VVGLYAFYCRPQSEISPELKRALRTPVEIDTVRGERILSAQSWPSAVAHAVSSFGAEVSRKLTAGGAEEQLKAPMERLLTVPSRGNVHEPPNCSASSLYSAAL
jgi:hypothetical protein